MKKIINVWNLWFGFSFFFNSIRRLGKHHLMDYFDASGTKKVLISNSTDAVRKSSLLFSKSRVAAYLGILKHESVNTPSKTLGWIIAVALIARLSLLLFWGSQVGTWSLFCYMVILFLVIACLSLDTAFLGIKKSSFFMKKIFRL